MKKTFLNCAAAALLSTAVLICTVPAFANSTITDFDLKPEFVEAFEAVGQNFTPIDLTSYATTGVADDYAGDGEGGWSDQGSINDFSTFRLKGYNKLKDVPFVFVDPVTNNDKSVLMLSGRDDKRLPLSVEVDINQKAGGMYILHNNVWGNSTGTLCGDYTYVYEDGTEYKIDQRCGYEIPSWWNDHISDYCITGWSGTNNTTSISASLYACVNPYPDKTIKKVRFTSNNFCYLAILGITLTDVRPVLLKEKITDWGNPDTTDWFIYEPCYDAESFAGTALDVSWLNKTESPLGHGRLTAVGEDFVYEDGTKMKFWGINYTLNRYPTHAEADYEAKRIAQSGFNCVRVSSPSQSEGNTTLFSVDVTTTRLLGFNSEAMDKFCYFLYALKREGISILLQQPNLSRSIRSADNNIQDMNKVGGAAAQYDDDIIALNNKVSEMFLSYVNPYTGIKIAEDESVQFVYLYNEFSIFEDTKYDTPYYYGVLSRLYNEWLREKYATRAMLESAWKTDDSSLVQFGADEDQFKDTVILAKPSEYHKYPAARVDDCMRFVSDLTEEKYSERYEFFRSLGFKGALIGSTLYGSNQIANKYSNAKVSDVLDVHYYSHLVNGAIATKGNSISVPKSDMESSKFKFFSQIGCNRLYNRAYTVTEWNATIPNPFASEVYLMMPVFSSFQNWSPFLYSWNEGTSLDTLIERQLSIKFLRDHKTLDVNEAPTMLYSLPVMSMIIRRGDVKEADKAFYSQRLTTAEALDADNQRESNDFSYGLVGRTGTFYDEIGYDEAVNSNEVLKLKVKGDKTGIYNSVTGELQTDLNNKIFKVNTERTQAATGYLKGNGTELDDVIFDIDNEFATVFLSSLSYDSLKECGSMLLTAVGRHRNWEQEMDEQASKFLTADEGPVIVEQLLGGVVLKSYDDFMVYALGGDGKRRTEVKTEKTPEGYTRIPLTRDDRTVNYEIVREAKSDIRCDKKVVFYDGTVENLVDDLGEYETYRNEIERMLLQGIIKETGEKQFSPNVSVTRGQFADMLVKALGISGKITGCFNDTGAEYEYANPVNILKSFDIVSGDDNGNFNPTSAVTIEDASVMIDKAVKLKNKTRGKNLPFDAESYSDWNDASGYAAESMHTVISEGYYTPYGTVNPKGELNRALAAVMIYNVLWK